MTLQEAKSIARHLGLTLRKVRSGDYRVYFRDGNETTAYYTDSLEDAVSTAVCLRKAIEELAAGRAREAHAMVANAAGSVAALREMVDRQILKQSEMVQ